MNIQPFNNQIEELAANGRRFYSDLTLDERKQLVASLIQKKGYVEIISNRDADDKTSLPDILAAVITSSTFPNIRDLVNKLMEMFVNGTQEKEAYFVDDIEEALEHACAYQENPISYLEELRQQDDRDRAKDMQQESRRYY